MMAGWSITRRVNTITFALLACVLLVGLMGVGSLLRLAAIFGEYQDGNNNVILTTEMYEHLAEAEKAELKFRDKATSEAAGGVIRNLDLIVQQRDQMSRQIAGDAALQEITARIFAGEEAFRAAFEAIQIHQIERNEAVERMAPFWEEAASGMQALETLLMFEGNQRVTSNLDSAKHSLLNGRVFVERFLFSNDPNDMTTAGGHFESARNRIEDSREIIANEARKDGFQAILVSLDGYWAAFDDAVNAILARNSQRVAIDDIVIALADDFDMLVDSVSAEQKELGLQSDRLTAVTLALMVGFVLLALAAGYLLARHIAKGTIKDIDASVDQMRALAEGNLDLDITGTEHEHELGQMARTLEVFRENARSAEALRAEQEAQKREAALRDAEAAEREKAMEAERAAKVEDARRAMIQELTQSVGAVVTAGAAGDFSHRIEPTFDAPELNRLAEGINDLVSNVESGVAETARVMEALAQGDLSDRMSGAFQGTFADLQTNVNDTIQQLAELVTQIAEQCDSLAGSAAQMNNQSKDLSRRAEQQAASLEETSAAMEEISASARSSAEGASSAAEFARSTSGQVDEAGKVVASAVQAMADIRDASGRIYEIVSVIDGIAFQTNLLALNASVEAARAGSAGKGFAVVATEVRALAQRSGEASKDIKALIDESTGQVERGVTLVEQTGQTLEQIMGGVSRMADTMQDLTTSAREQATGVGEITAAITQLDTITQKNAAVSDESRGTSEAVQSLSDAIRQMVGRFRTAPNQHDPALTEGASFAAE